MTRVSERWHVQHMGGTYPDQFVYIGGTSTYDCGSTSSYCVGQIDVCHKTEEARREAYRKANIAAAGPEMLAALKALVAAMDWDGLGEREGRVTDAKRAAQRAIAKAEGGAR